MHRLLKWKEQNDGCMRRKQISHAADRVCVSHSGRGELYSRPQGASGGQAVRVLVCVCVCLCSVS